jgi:capsular polysaccharide biosynthesis protein
MATQASVTTEPQAEGQPTGLAANLPKGPGRRWLAIACLILIPAVVYGVSRLQADSYEASAVVQVKGESVDTFLLIGETPVNSPPLQAIDAATRLVNTRPVAARAAAAIPAPGPSAGSVLDAVSARSDRDAAILTITARDKNARQAAEIANATAQAVSDVSATRARAQIDAALTELEDQLATLSSDERENRGNLLRQLTRLRALRAALRFNVVVIEKATTPTSPVSPRPIRNAFIALMFAALLAVTVLYWPVGERRSENLSTQRWS